MFRLLSAVAVFYFYYCYIFHICSPEGSTIWTIDCAFVLFLSHLRPSVTFSSVVFSENTIDITLTHDNLSLFLCHVESLAIFILIIPSDRFG